MPPIDEARLQAYQNLVEALLQCPYGEEIEVLQANSEFVDAGLVQILLQVTTNLIAQIHLNEANFLMTLAGYLMGVYSNITVKKFSSALKQAETFKFLMQVLQTTAETDGNPQVVYSLLAENLDKLNENLAEVLHQWASVKLRLVDAKIADQIAADITNFSNFIQHFTLGNRASNLEIAIAGYEIVAIVFTQEAHPQEWAKVQNNLGDAFYDRMRKERRENLEKAIAAYAATLQTYTQEEYPKEWANTQNNLGNAYLDRINGERRENLKKALAFYEKALQVYTCEAYPKEWAGTHINLGNAYLYIIREKQGENIEKAIAAYKKALQVYTREAYPYEWARIQNNLGNAYNNRISKERGPNLETAIATLEEALEVLTREVYPEEWATIQINLGIAYRNRISEDRRENREKAVAAYKAALQVFTREAYPYKWARIQNNLGNVYLDGIIGDCWQNLEKAAAAYDEALQVRTREAYPQEHITTLFNLGVAYQESAKLLQADAQTQLRLADTTFASAIHTVESIRAQIVVGGDEAKQKLAEEWNNLYRNMVEVCLELGESDRAIEYAERSKARNLVELLANRDLYPKGDIPQPILDELDRLRREIDAEQKRQEIQERTRNSYGGTISEERSPEINALQTTIPNRDRLNQLRQQLDELIVRDITPIDSNFRLTQKVEPISYSEIQSLTSENTAILEWYVTGDKFLTFIITPQSPTPIVWQSSPEDFEALMKWANEYLTAYRTNKTQWRQELADRLESLAEILHIDKLLSHIPPTVDRLVLIPHRFLHLFPLHALQGKRQKINSDNGELYTATGYLIDLFTAGVRYAPSCQLLQQAQTRQRQEFDRLFALQNPTNDLDYTDIEVAAIRQHFHPSHVLVKNDASKANLEGHVPEPGVAIGDAHCAHFSCHGYFNFENPLLSALLLADCYLEPAPLELDPTRHLRLQDGKALDLGKCLTFADLFALDLGACRLVVLSACETGFSDFNSTSDEYISLPSGLLVAGSPSVVGSLWAVNDLSTALLMMRFYENVKAGLSVAVALNTAQIWLRDAKKEQLQQWTSQQTLDDAAQRMQLRLLLSKIDANTQPFASPDYWAAFCAIGQ